MGTTDEVMAIPIGLVSEHQSTGRTESVYGGIGDMNTILAWHFVKRPGILRDGRKVEVGKWLHHDGRVVICQSGFHGSINPLHALEYAPDSGVCRVEHRIDITHQSDKLVSRERRVIWYSDGERVLRLFAADCAERALRMCKRKGYNTDQRSFDAVRAARLYANGKIGAAAWDAARDAARDAAWATAWATAGAAARAAARDAASAAAWTTTWATARATARYAEAEWQSKRLISYLNSLAPRK
jgi:hypothetical protein